MKGLIPYASTELQAKVIEMRAEGKTWEAITELTGMDASNGRKIIAKVKRRAANAGFLENSRMWTERYLLNCTA